LGGGYSRNIGGQQLAEFQELTATAAAGVVTVTTTSAYRGKPFTLTATKSSTSGTVTVATPTAATGPNHADNADNWEGGTLPTTGDIMRFDTGNVSVLHGLTYYTDNTIECSIEITGDYTGQIGLPQFDAGLGYAEYRPRYFEALADAADRVCYFLPGVRGLTDHSDVRLHLESGTNQWNFVGSYAARGSSSTVPNVFLHLNDVNNLEIVQGRVSINPAEADGLTGSAAVLEKLTVGGGTSAVGSAAYCIVNSSVELNGCEVIECLGGTLILKCAFDYTGGGTPEFNVYGGTCSVEPVAGAETRDIVVQGGTLKPNYSLFLTNSPKMTVHAGGVIDFRESSRSRGIARIVLHGGSAVYDPDGKGTTVYDLVGCDLQDVTLQIASGKKLTLSTAAV
jgi:hypothetical protein